MTSADSAIVIGGDPECVRVRAFQSALQRSGRPPAAVLRYDDVLSNKGCLARALRPGTLLRIESPGKSPQAEMALLQAGAAAAQAEPYEWVSAEMLGTTPRQKGHLGWPRQWYLGLKAAMADIRRQLAAAPACRLMAVPEDIVAMFDKPETLRRLHGLGLPVPHDLGSPENFDDLRERMARHGVRRVFVKLAHGSSASGAVAYETNGIAHRAQTTVEMSGGGQSLLLFNSRRVRTLDRLSEIVRLIDALARHRLHAETWVPKAAIHTGNVDLRLVVIRGHFRLGLARVSCTPFTNLHLLNTRADLASIRARVGEALWAEIIQAAEQAMRDGFPQSLYGGIDVAITSDWRAFRILEVNAFGDQLPGLTSAGADTYDLELQSLYGLAEARLAV